jgi:hypothetical protein
MFYAFIYVKCQTVKTGKEYKILSFARVISHVLAIYFVW